MLAERLLGRLHGVIRTGERRWSARCPAHDDRSPSLSVRVEGTRVLFHCHAGCAPEAVLAALELGWRDLYEDPWIGARQAALAQAGWQSQRQLARRRRQQGIDLALERMILRIAAADLRRGRTLSIEDRGRVAVARMRLEAAAAGEPR
jgi:hypothetical protein